LEGQKEADVLLRSFLIGGVQENTSYKGVFGRGYACSEYRRGVCLGGVVRGEPNGEKSLLKKLGGESARKT